MGETVSMDNTKAEIIEHLEALDIELNGNLTKAELLEILDEASPEVEETSPEVEETPPPALVEDDIVTVRGTSVGGVIRMKRSEYEARQKK